MYLLIAFSANDWAIKSSGLRNNINISHAIEASLRTISEMKGQNIHQDAAMYASI